MAELRHKLNDVLDQLSPERLQVLTDFAAYLANAESEAATQELFGNSWIAGTGKTKPGHSQNLIRDTQENKVTNYQIS